MYAPNVQHTIVALCLDRCAKAMGQENWSPRAQGTCSYSFGEGTLYLM